MTCRNCKRNAVVSDPDACGHARQRVGKRTFPRDVACYSACVSYLTLIRRLLAFVAIAGLVLARMARPTGAMSMNMPAAMGSSADSGMAMPSDMECCPEESSRPGLRQGLRVHGSLHGDGGLHSERAASFSISLVAYQHTGARTPARPRWARAATAHKTSTKPSSDAGCCRCRRARFRSHGTAPRICREQPDAVSSAA